MGGRCAAVLLAAGSGRRLGFDKVLTPLAGRPVLEYSLGALLEAPEVDEIRVMTREDILAAVEQLVRGLRPGKPVVVARGGAERRDSVMAGLEGLGEGVEWVLIHDAARPLLTAEGVGRVLAAAREHGSAVCGRPATDTLKWCEDGETVARTLDRSRVWQVETPQVFRRVEILEAYRLALARGGEVTDDASAMEAAGRTVRLFPVEQANLKITRAADWELLGILLGRGVWSEVRRLVHRINNALTPLAGYLPLLGRERFSEEGRLRMERLATGSAEALGALAELQRVAREQSRCDTSKG
jgi:2-C-methyl-D-erythritol 4-phosphate cytidylyltransferase